MATRLAIREKRKRTIVGTLYDTCFDSTRDINAY